MRTAYGIVIVVSIGALIALAVARTTQAQRAGNVASSNAKLSFASDAILMTLAVSHPQHADELSDNSAIYGQGFKEGIRDLSEKDLIIQLPNAQYDLSRSGVIYVDEHYEVIRDGDRTTINKRGP